MQYISYRTIIAALLGIMSAILAGMLYAQFFAPEDAPHLDGDVHVHADFLVYLDGVQLDFTDEKYQSDERDTKHFYMHLHNDNGHVVHRHAEDVTFADFLASLGFLFTDTCLTTDTDQTYCTNDENVLRLYVNGAVQEDPTTYITQEDDSILVYYGTPDAGVIAEYLAEVPNDACIASGTCPERGLPQPETCGATCEI